MRALFAVERRLQELAVRLENLFRHGTITDTKYDKDKKRWYVKIADGPQEDSSSSQGSSSSSSSSSSDPKNPTWSTPDWVPWGAFSHGTIKMSFPPKKGQKAQITSHNGYPEMGIAEPFGYSPNNPAPDGDPDKIHIRVEAETKNGQAGTDKNKILDHVWTQDGATTSIGNSNHGITKDTISHTTDDHKVKSKTHSVDTGKVTVQASESHTTTTQVRTVTAQNTTITGANYALNSKVMINCGMA
jgi:phage baseplate assembly protein gpV